GAGLALLSAVLGAATAGVYKWDITHYNSVAGEQITVYAFVVLFFYLQATRRAGSPLKLLIRRASGTQSLLNGLGLAIESFAYSFAPASVIIALKKSFSLLW